MVRIVIKLVKTICLSGVKFINVLRGVQKHKKDSQVGSLFTLMGSTVNFINVKRANFLYELRFSSYVLALSKNLYEKFVHKTLMKLTPARPKAARKYVGEIDPRCQFH